MDLDVLRVLDVLDVERTAPLQQLVDPAELRFQDRLSLDDALAEHPLRDAALEKLGKLLGWNGRLK